MINKGVFMTSCAKNDMLVKCQCYLLFDRMSEQTLSDPLRFYCSVVVWFHGSILYNKMVWYHGAWCQLLTAGPLNWTLKTGC